MPGGANRTPKEAVDFIKELQALARSERIEAREEAKRQ